tara:strand:+ start:617 stop:826 length:210 start_codon:yes stop_codon:yes gene_type:complete
MYGDMVTREMPKGGDKMAVNREDFEAYEGVRRSGMVNMFDPMARELAGLDKKTFINIMKDYDYLKEKFE